MRNQKHWHANDLPTPCHFVESNNFISLRNGSLLIFGHTHLQLITFRRSSVHGHAISNYELMSALLYRWKIRFVEIIRKMLTSFS